MDSAARHSLLAPSRSPLGGYVMASLAGHALLVVAGLAYAKLGLGPSIDLNQKPITATLVRMGKPREEKLLPRKEELPPPPEPSEGPKPEPVAPVEPAVAIPVPTLKAPPPKPVPTKQAGEKTQAADRRKKLFGAFSRTSKAASAEELEGQADGDPQGNAAKEEGERYFGLLQSQVNRNYELPQTLSEQERMYLKAYVALTIGKTGEVIRARIAKTSGNASFDSAVLSAVQRASPFSPPPDHLRERLASQGVVLEFSP